MDIYLPIAGLSVNALFIVALGFLVGLLSGMFGVGGGFLTTPLLIFYGIPPTVAVASATTQITGSSVSGVHAHWRRGGVDLRMGGVMIAGGLAGSLIGAALFRVLQTSGQIDLIIGFLYVLLLGSIGGLMLKDAMIALGWVEPPDVKVQPRHNKWVASLPGRWRFYASGLYISPLAPLALGFFAGILTVLLGVGGGFILVPAMIYCLGMAARVVIGTSLVMILAVSAVTTLVQADDDRSRSTSSRRLLLVGGVIGAQYGARLTTRLKPDLLRLALAVIILAVALRMALGLAWRPDEIYTVLLPVRRGASSPGTGRAFCWLALEADAGARCLRPVDRESATASPARSCCCSAPSSIPTAECQASRRISPSSSKGPVQPILVREKHKIAGIWMNADSHRFRSAPASTPSPRPSRSRTLVDERTAAIYELGPRQSAAVAGRRRAARQGAALRGGPART
jgi:uncharacterized membrane protein YfcA